MNRKKLIKECLKGRCNFEGNWCFGRWRRYWMTFKTIVAIILNREYEGIEKYDVYDETVEVSTYYNIHKFQGPEFMHESWDVVRGTIKGFRFIEDGDGYP